MDLQLLLPLVIFVGVIRLTDFVRIHPVIAACISIVIPYIITLTTRYILINGHPSVAQLLTHQEIIIFVLKVLLAVFVFYRLEQHEDSLGSRLVTTVLGAFAIFILVPMVVREFVPL